MLYEMRIYTLPIGQVGEFEKSLGKVFNKEEMPSFLGCFHAEIGDLNRVMHIWKYESTDEGKQTRKELAQDPWRSLENAPPILGQATKLMRGVPFRPEPLIGALGPVYEFRTYTIKPGEMNNIISLWAQNLSSRESLSPLAACFTTEVGPLNQFIHVWAYRDLNHRAEVRSTSRKLTNWHLGREFMVAQNTEVWMPAAFSPMH